MGLQEERGGGETLVISQHLFPLFSLNVAAAITLWHLEILVSNKGNYKQGEKTALRMGENNSKWSNRQRINHKNIQATPEAQFQKNKWPNQNMGQRTKQTFLQRRHTDG